MKIKSKNKKYLKIALALTVLLSTAVVVYAVFFSGILKEDPQNSEQTALSNRTLDGINDTLPTKEQSEGGSSAKKDLAEENTGSLAPNTLSIDLSAFKKSNGDVRITANIQDIVTSSGKCHLTVTKEGVIEKYEASLVAMSGYSSCKGFDIPDLEKGIWQIDIDVTSNGRSGSAKTNVEA